MAGGKDAGVARASGREVAEQKEKIKNAIEDFSLYKIDIVKTLTQYIEKE